jgi:hypothetical protein
MINMALTALGLMVAAAWLDSFDGRGTRRVAVPLTVYLLALGAFIFCALDAIGALT